MRAPVVALFALMLSCALASAAGAPPEAWSDAKRPDPFAGLDSLRRASRWTQHDSLLAVALSRAEGSRPPDTSAMAKALYLQARTSWDRRQFNDPLIAPRFERAIALLRAQARPDTARLIEAVFFRGNMLSELEHPDSALRYFEDARAMCSPTVAGGDTLRDLTWFQTGRAQRRLRLADEALKSLEIARAAYVRRVGPADPRVATIMAEVASTYLDQTRFDEAVAVAQQVIEIQERASGPNTPDILRALSIIAEAQYRTGDIAGSIQSIQRQLDIAIRRGGESDPRVWAYRFNLALRYFDFGDYAGARSRLEPMIAPSESLFGVGASRTERTRAMTGVAALLSGDTATAARYLERAWTELAKKPNDPFRFMAFADRWLGRLYLTRGDLASARRSIQRGLATERGNPRPQLEMMMSLLEAQLELAMASRDTALLDSALAGMVGQFPTPASRTTIAYATYHRLAARGDAWRGRGDDAWAHALAAERFERARLISNLRSLPDRRGLELAGGLAEPLGQMVLLARDRDESAVEAAWDRLVQWRGLVGAEVVGRRAPTGAAADTALMAAHARWISARRRNARLEVADAEDPSALAASRAEAEEAERRFAALADARGIRHDTASVNLARLRARLRPDVALVSLVQINPPTDASRCIAFVTRGPAGALRLVDLGPAPAIAADVEAWRAALATPPASGRARAEERACAELGRAVRAATWDRIAPAIGDARDVVLVADGVLADVPWQALPDRSGRYLVETGPTLHALGAERELLAHDEPTGRGMLALGGPDFRRVDAGPTPAGALVAADVRGPLANCRTSARLAFAPLPGAAAEVAEVADLWDASHADARALRRLGAEATEEAFKRVAPGRAIVHLATHGIVWGDSCAPVVSRSRGVGGVGPVRPRARKSARTAPATAPAAPAMAPADPTSSPWLGRQVWLALAGANAARAGGPDENEGLLTADEISVMDLRGVDWIVLSACHSGFGEAWPLEGSVGMARAFRLAGARTVIASQWSIGDESTREWMSALYRARATGAKAGACLRDANRQVLAARRSSRRTTHPFYWAAFTSNGE